MTNSSPSEREWDMAISPVGNRGRSMHVNLPASLSGALREAGMYRCTVRVTEQGILVVPYVHEQTGKRGRPRLEAVELPDWKPQS